MPARRTIVRAARCGGVGDTEGALCALLRRGHTGWVWDHTTGASHAVEPRRADVRAVVLGKSPRKRVKKYRRDTVG